MKIEILFLGKTKDSYLETGINDFVKRISHYTPVDINVIKVRKKQGRNDCEIKSYESSLLNQQVPAGAFRIVLDSKGKKMSSEKFSGFISELEQRGIKNSCFIIGGPTGLDKEQIQAADLVMSFSDLTFTHDIMRLLLLEQIYRAYTIKAGEKYHK